MTDVDVAVVGVGVMGAATAWSLARAGREVLMLEQFDIGHRRGSSHGASRIFRLSYEDPRFVRMAQEAHPKWRALEAASGRTLLTRTGGLDIGEKLEEHARALKECGAPFEQLNGDEVAGRFPHVSRSVGPALFQPDGGIVAADDAVRAFVDSATAAGGTVLERTPVMALHDRGERVEIRTDAETYRARIAVVTAGAWAAKLLAGAGIRLPTRPTRETVAYFRVDDDGPLPAVVDWGTPAVYSLPSPGQGLKAGEHRAGPDTDPEREGSPDDSSVARISSWVRDRFPAADPKPHLTETCLYTNTADEGFILERHGAIVVGSACSGHGFKFAPVIGDRLAALARS
ncbi:MAG TPA: N-methyl-L-tryptophan oxidase [Actinomycetota bacterium]|nr:N-methyl-L-tryptophan oxidase [Actinomycetota bacterium]